MGCCCSNLIPSTIYTNPCNDGELQLDTIQYKVVLKLPHGLKYLDYENKTFVEKESIDNWLYSNYSGKRMTHYINYNDEHDVATSGTGGHCKGCLAWNEETEDIIWLIHSVPKFMVYFTEEGYINKELTRVEKSEQMYGQSFVLVTNIPYFMLSCLRTQLAIMHPFIDVISSNTTLPIFLVHDVAKFTITSYRLSMIPQIDHIAKSSRYHIDIYSEYIQPTYGGKWLCETWTRGHECPNDELVKNNTSITFSSESYSSHQDHSKYACNDSDMVFIGDLNRMTSQAHRGGGGIAIKNKDLALAFRSIMK